MEFTLEQLNNFLGKAALATYAGGGKIVDPSRPDFVSRFPGFKELEYKEGDFYYRDSYAGFFTSAGQEVVWFKEKPVWTQVYGGGMLPEFQSDEAFTHRTFDFLKKALSHGEEKEAFQPRGEREFVFEDWKYQCDWGGDITSFKGSEEILFKGQPVFRHDFSGGLLKWG